METNHDDFKLAPLPCPFCGKEPKVYLLYTDIFEGAWGTAACQNAQCLVQPRVEGQLGAADDSGADEYKALAIGRWNQRWENHLKQGE